ncbi:MAG: hypothetical protein AAGA48_25735 [Myxococcota bacterium]
MKFDPSIPSLLPPDWQLVLHESAWERQVWLLKTASKGGPERQLIGVVAGVLAVMVVGLVVTGELTGEQFLALTLLGVAISAGIVASYIGPSYAVKLDREGITVGLLESGMPHEVEFEGIWSWPMTTITRLSWREVRSFEPLDDGKLRISLAKANARPWILGKFSPEVLATLGPAIEQGIRMWGAHRDRAPAVLAEVEALTDQAKRKRV